MLSVRQGIGIAAGALLVFLLSIVLSGRYFGATGIMGASAFWTSALTAGLVFLYFQQYRVLDNQTRWMKRRFESAVAYSLPFVADEDHLYIRLSNGGPGGVMDMRLRTELVDPDPVEFDIEPGFYQLRTPHGRQTKLPGYGERRWFKGKAKFAIPEDDGYRSLPFKFLSSRLEAESCTLRFTLEVLDEARFGDTPLEIEIGEQEVELPEIEEVELPGEDGTQTVKHRPSTTLEDGLPPKRPQTVISKEFQLVGDHEIPDFLQPDEATSQKPEA